MTRELSHAPDGQGHIPNTRPIIEAVKLKNFTAFSDVEIRFGPAVNAIIGENATGKTHLLKLLYVAASSSRNNDGNKRLDWVGRLHEYFFSAYAERWNLVNSRTGAKKAIIEVLTSTGNILADIEDLGKLDDGGYQTMSGQTADIPYTIPAVFIPAKDMLSHKKGFLAEWNERHLYFEREYVDYISKCDLAARRVLSRETQSIMKRLEMAIHGTVEDIDDVFYHVSEGLKLEFTLVSEGRRKLAGIWLLLRNGLLTPGSLLFWDEPEANLNPQLMDETVEVILELSRIGVQVFFATHSYVMLKELDLRMKANDKVLFHSLYRNDQDVINCESVDSLLKLQHNRVLDKYVELYDLEVRKVAERIRNGH